MLFIVFQLGGERYAIEATRVVEVVPLLTLKQVPQAPKGLAGILNYRGRAVPAVDISQIALDTPSAALLSTRIIVTNCADGQAEPRLVGLIAERATEILRKDPSDFSQLGLEIRSAPYLGPILLDDSGTVQWIRAQHLLPDPMREFLARDALAAPQT